MDIDDAYTAFCFDEACAYIHMEVVENKRTPDFNVFREQQKAHYTRPSEFYNSVKGVNK